MLFTLNRDKVVTTLSGHAIEFKKGKPTHVPFEAFKDVLAVGAVAEEDMPDEEVVESKEPKDPAKRKELILATMKALAQSNKREDFTGTGVPTQKAMDEQLGFKLDSSERTSLWTEFKQGGANA